MAAVFAAVLCGGSGTRLWPLSRRHAPKQLIPLLGGRSLLAETVARVTPLTGPERLLLLTGEAILDRSLEEAGAVGATPLAIVEPAARNTAPAAAAAALEALSHDPDALVALLPADHFIADAAAFRAALQAALALAAEGRVVTLGVEPSGPNVGYGYIERGAPIPGGYAVAAFKEKPDLATAQRYLSEGGRYWNSGVYVFAAATLCEELERHAPDVLAATRAAFAAGSGGPSVRRLGAQAWAACPSISIDHAVAERTDRAAVVPVDMGWNDVGAWDALHDIASGGGGGNVTEGPVVLEDASGNFVRSSGRVIAVLGVQDLIIVETPDAVLVLPRSRAAEVKRLVDRLAAGGREDVL